MIFWTSLLVATLLVMVVMPGRDGTPSPAPQLRGFMILPGLGFLVVAPWAWGKGGARLAGGIAAGGLALVGAGVEQALSLSAGRLLFLPMVFGFAAYAVWLASPEGAGEDKRWGAFGGAVLFAVGAAAYASGAM